MSQPAPLKDHRSNCPLNLALELIGDKWSLLILRDMMVAGKRRYSEFLASPESISTNILASRLRRLEQGGLVERFKDPLNARAVIYLPTRTGLDLLPAIVEIVRWGMKFEQQHGGVPAEIASCLTHGCHDLAGQLRDQIEQERGTLVS